MMFPKKTRTKKSNSRTGADINFSYFIKIRDITHVVDGMTLEAITSCISCGRFVYWRSQAGRRGAECGHFVERGNYVLRYNEMNCNSQCFDCNRFPAGTFRKFYEGIDRKHGRGTADILLKESIIGNFNKVNLEEIRIKYRQKAIDIASEKGLDVEMIRRRLR